MTEKDIWKRADEYVRTWTCCPEPIGEDPRGLLALKSLVVHAIRQEAGAQLDELYSRIVDEADFDREDYILGAEALRDAIRESMGLEDK